MGNRNHKKTSPGLVTMSIIAVSVSFLAIASLLTINNGVLATVTSFMSDSFATSATTSDTSASQTETTENSTLPTTEKLPYEDIFFARPDQMKGAWVKAGTDYYIDGNEGGQAVREQIDAALAKLSEWGFNTVIVPIATNGNTFYISQSGAGSISIENTNGTDFDPPEYINQQARERGMFTYGVIDFRVNTHDLADPSTPDGAAAILKMTREAAERYSFDGWMLDNPGYAKGKGGSYAEYMQVMPGGGFDRFKRDSVTATVKGAVQTIKAQNKNLYVGLLADSVWANGAENELGSATKAAYAQYTDGFADTRTWVKDGLFDFVMVKNGYSTLNSSVPFDKVIGWWSELCEESKRPLYTAHDSSLVGGTAQGWKSPDQLAQQVLACKKSDWWQGSSFTSLSSLIKDTTGSTLAMLNAFKGSLNEEYISRKLVFNTPTKTNHTTYESKISIRGSADPNFPLTMNNNPVTLTAHGFFSLDFDLAVGNNTYTFKHKGDTVTYNITYKVVVIQSVEPSQSLTLEGGTSIRINATAYKGSNIYAKLGNTTIKMKQAPTKSDEDNISNEDSDYINYAGEYTLPKGIREKAQALGTITFYGSYKTLNESKNGGSLTVKAIPAPPPTTTVPSTSSGGTTGTSVVVDPIDPGTGGGKVLSTGKIMMISRDYAETFSGSTTDDYSRPVNAYLPKGTMDVFVKDVYDSKSGSYYYLLGSGRRVYSSYATDYKASGKLTANSLTLGGVDATTASTDITLKSKWHIPYNVRLLPQKFGNEATQNYNMTAFTATYVELTFYYTTSVSGTIDVSGSTLFKSSKWIKGDGNTYILRLDLHNKGAFYGYSVRWDNDGNLTFSFKNPEGMGSQSKPLTGKRIVIDPGHGGTSSGATRDAVKEKHLALTYSKLLRDKLTALGATVVMTRTGDTLPDKLFNPESIYARNNFARNNHTDMFISIHMNSFTSSSPRGYTVNFFNEYSYPLAKSIDKAANTAYTNSGGKSNRYSTVVWSPFAVARLHDCPSILLECAFMSNDKDLEMLISSKYQNALATELAKGIVDYFKPISAIYSTVSATVKSNSQLPSTAVATTTLIAPAGMIALIRKRKKSK